MAIKKNENSRKSLIWVRDQEGETYLCPAGQVSDPDNPTEEELRQCVIESFNPHND